MPSATFELDQLDRLDGHVVVTGRWHGVRGLRFMRPTLIVGRQQALATLDGKPWAPDAEPWRAVFPWDGGPVDVAAATLSVAPSVTVPLSGAPAATPAPGDGSGEEPAAERLRARRLADEVTYLRRELAEARREADAARQDADAARREAEAARQDADAARRDAAASPPAPERPPPEPEPAPPPPAPDLTERLQAAHAELDRLREVAADRDGLRAELTAAHAELAQLRPAVPPRPPHPDDEAPSGVLVGHPDAPRRRTAGEELGLSHAEQLLGRVLGVAAVICLLILAITFAAALF